MLAGATASTVVSGKHSNQYNGLREATKTMMSNQSWVLSLLQHTMCVMRAMVNVPTGNFLGQEQFHSENVKRVVTRDLHFTGNCNSDQKCLLPVFFSFLQCTVELCQWEVYGNNEHLIACLEFGWWGLAFRTINWKYCSRGQICTGFWVSCDPLVSASKWWVIFAQLNILHGQWVNDCLDYFSTDCWQIWHSDHIMVVWLDLFMHSCLC